MNPANISNIDATFILLINKSVFLIVLLLHKINIEKLLFSIELPGLK